MELLSGRAAVLLLTQLQRGDMHATCHMHVTCMYMYSTCYIEGIEHTEHIIITNGGRL